MINWLAYNCFIPLLPIPLVVLGSWLIGTRISVITLLADGQLCFYCTAISAVELQDIIKAKDTITCSSTSLAVFGIIFCMILSLFSFGISIMPQQKDNGKLALISILSAITTTMIVALSRNQMGLI